MRALQLTARWPVPNVAAAVLLPDGSVATIGDTSRTFRIASIAKMLVGWTLLVADEEGTLALDTPAGQPGCTVRHLMAHAGGYAFDGPDPIAKPGVRRIYSNTGIDLAAAAPGTRLHVQKVGDIAAAHLGAQQLPRKRRVGRLHEAI